MGYAKWLAGILLTIALLIFPEVTTEAVREAMRTWAGSVAPALFPFLLLTPLLTCRESAEIYERLLGRLMRPLLKLPGSAAPVIAIGMLAGSPAGAAAAAGMAGSAGLTKGQLERLLMCVCGMSPAFLTAGIGAELLRSPAAGAGLAAAQALTQLTMLILTRGYRGSGETVNTRLQPADINPIRTTAAALLNICGYMAAFGALGAGIACVLRQGWVRIAAACLLDVPGGAAMIAKLSLNSEIKAIVLAGMVGFGGISIGIQNLSAAKGGIGAGKYFTSRLSAALLMMGMTTLGINLRGAEGLKTQKWMEISALQAAGMCLPICTAPLISLFLNKRKLREK